MDLTIEEGRLPRVWLFEPGNNAYAWKEFYDAGILGMGWDKLQNYDQYLSQEAIEEKLKEAYLKRTGRPRNSARGIWQFLNEMKIGDIVFAKKGMSQIIGKGIVTSEPRFDPNRKAFRNYRTVNWTNNEVKENEGKFLPQVTLSPAQPHRMDFLMSLYKNDQEKEDK
ncbi:MAG: hypothetical protein LUC43_07950 [Burkholderiales bacterium]|nr:hypothetical protein [Burkholderiales bacterium]